MTCSSVSLMWFKNCRCPYALCIVTFLNKRCAGRIYLFYENVSSVYINMHSWTWSHFFGRRNTQMWFNCLRAADLRSWWSRVHNFLGKLFLPLAILNAMLLLFFLSSSYLHHYVQLVLVTSTSATLDVDMCVASTKNRVLNATPFQLKKSSYS